MLSYSHLVIKAQVLHEWPIQDQIQKSGLRLYHLFKLAHTKESKSNYYAQIIN